MSGWRSIVADTAHVLSSPINSFDDMDWAELLLWHAEARRLAGLQTAAAGLRGMALAIPGVSGLATAMTAVGGALAAVSAPVWGGISIAVAAVAAAAYSLWKYWDRISAFVGGFASALMTQLQPAFAALEPVMRPLTTLGRAIGDGFSWAYQKLQEFGAWIAERSSHLDAEGVGRAIEVDISVRRAAKPSNGSFFSAFSGVFA